MLIVRGLLLTVDGFIFVFMPALLFPVLLRRQPGVKGGLIWWGAGTFLVALLPTFFLSSLARQILQPDDRLADRAILVLIGALISGVLVVGAQWLLLRWRKPPLAMLPVSGMLVGLGAGIVNQIFTGFAHIGAGFRLLFFGDTSTPELAALAAVPIGLFALKLLAELVSRAALFVVNGGLGYMVGRSLTGQRGWLPLAMLLYAAFALMLPLIQLGLAEQETLFNGIAILVEGAIGGLALYWLLQVPTVEGGSAEKRTEKAKKRRQ